MSYHLPLRVGRELLPDLLEVVGHVVGGEAAVAHREIDWLALGYRGNCLFVQVLVERGHEKPVVDRERLLAVNLLGGDFRRERNAEPSTGGRTYSPRSSLYLGF